MARIELLLPKMGESITDATILTWLKEVGDQIEMDEAIVEIATDKVDSEVPSTHEGVLVEILYKEGDVVEVGKPLAVIETEVSTSAAVAPSQTPVETQVQSVVVKEALPPIVEEQVQVQAKDPSANPFLSVPNPSTSKSVIEIQEEILETPYVPAAAAQVPVQVQTTPGNGHSNSEIRFYSPLVLNIAGQEGISMSELEAIPGTGNNSRLTKKDLLFYIKKKANGTVQTPSAIPSNSTTAPQAQVQANTEKASPAKPTSAPAAIPSGTTQVTADGNVEIIEMDRMRKMIAENMLNSKKTSAHVTSFVEADVTNLVAWRNKHKKIFKEREGQNLTFTPLFMEAIVKAIRDYPMINVSVDGDKIIRKKFINMGMAAAMPNGNLIVPVIKDADQLSLIGLAKKVNDLADRARRNKLKLDEIQGATYTISNVGSFGNVMGTPIIAQPQVAIMAVGAIRKKVVVVQDQQGNDQIAIRSMMYLSHSYDHRVVDGALGGMFVRKMADYLEAWDLNREI